MLLALSFLNVERLVILALIALARPLDFLRDGIYNLDLLLVVIACILAINIQIEIRGS